MVWFGFFCGRESFLLFGKSKVLLGQFGSFFHPSGRWFCLLWVFFGNLGSTLVVVAQAGMGFLGSDG